MCGKSRPGKPCRGCFDSVIACPIPPSSITTPEITCAHKAHCISGSIDVCGAAGVLGPVEGTCSVEVAVAVEESMVVVAGFLQREPKPSPMLGLPWLLYTLLFSLLLLSLLFIQNTESLVQEIHLFSGRVEARNAQHCMCEGQCGSIPLSPCSLHEDQAG